MIRHLVNVARAAIHEARKRQERSSRWRDTERAFLRENGSCAGCGTLKRLQVHHQKPWHLYPELENVASNLLTLCMSERECHLLLGHGDNFKAYNPNVAVDAAEALAYPDRFSAIAARAKANRLT